MQALAEALVDRILPDGDDESAAWELIKAAFEAGDHLEAALEKHPLTNDLLAKVVSRTWDLIARDDYELLKSAISQSTAFPLKTLFTGLFRSTNRNIQVITTNYDRAIEYAADTGGYIHNSGFLPGYLRRADGAENLYFRQGNYRARTVTIWKVHGSLDWFTDSAGGVISLPLTSDLPVGLTPLIITPGVSKYQRTHDEPFRSAIQGADRALKSASAIICIGYGFRDSHIHPKLMTRCRVHDVPILVAARTLTPEAKEFLSKSAGRHFIALENHSNGTIVYTRENPQGEVLEGVRYWDLTELNDLIGF